MGKWVCKKSIWGYFVFFALFMVNIKCYAGFIGYINIDTEKIYSSYSVNSNVIGNAIKGMKVEILDEYTDDEDTEWYYVYLQTGTKGYIFKDSVTVKPKETVKELYVKAIDSANIRELPTTESKILGSLKKGNSTAVIDIYTNNDDETWYLISYDDKEGYVKKTSVEEEIVERETEETEVESIYIEAIEATHTDSDVIKKGASKAEENTLINEEENRTKDNNTNSKSSSRINITKKMFIQICVLFICIILIVIQIKKIIRINRISRRKGRK